ncbi:MAG: TIGR00266 family protein [Myxococcales bacterium]|nr:TIGR00266 family protein [Myxococcales bacterium]
MRFEILYPGSYAMAKATLAQDEQFRAESGAMVAMTSTVDVEGKMEGGLWKALKRKAVGGESMFMQTLKATRGPGEVFIAPSTPGDLALLELNGANNYFLQKEGFLAAESGVTLETVSQGIFKGIMSGEGVFVQRVGGQGKLLVSSFGAIHKLALAPGENYVVDNGHLVAWSGTVTYEIKKASSGWLSSATSGEGFVCHLTGPGDVYFQTRNAASFGQWVASFIPAR